MVLLRVIKLFLAKDPNRVLTVLNPLGDSVKEMLTAPLPLFRAREFPGRDRRQGNPGQEKRDSVTRRESVARRTGSAALSSPSVHVVTAVTAVTVDSVSANPLIAATDVVSSADRISDEVLIVPESVDGAEPTSPGSEA